MKISPKMTNNNLVIIIVMVIILHLKPREDSYYNKRTKLQPVLKIQLTFIPGSPECPFRPAGQALGH